MIAVAVLQLLLVAGVLEFDVQVVLVVATFLVVYAWVIASARPATAMALCRGRSPVSGCCSGCPFRWAWSSPRPAALSLGVGSPLAFVIPGVAVAAIGWLALPVWPLVLARMVFSKPSSHSVS